MGDQSDPRVELQAGLGKPPDAPGGGVGLRGREYLRTTQPGPGGLQDVQFVVGGGGGGPGPQPPGAGALLLAPVNQDDVPMATQASSQGPPRPPGGGGALIPHYGPNAHEFLPYAPGDMPGPAPQPRKRATPYDTARTQITGKPLSPWQSWDEFQAADAGMDTAPSNPGAIEPMAEHNTVPKRSREEQEEAKKKKKPTPAPPSLPPPPPNGAATLRPTAPPEEESLVPLDGLMHLAVPTSLAPPSSSSGHPPTAEPSKKDMPVPEEEEEELLQPLDGVLELPALRRLSPGNQRLW